MDFDINALDLLWLALGMIAYAASATLWAYLAVPRERRERHEPRVPVLPSNAYFESTPLEDLPAAHVRLAK